MDQRVKIALLGSGTVGSGVITVLKENRREIAKKTDAEIEIKKVLVRNLGKTRPILEGFSVTDKIEDILADEEISVVVELMGGIDPAKDYMIRALEAGKSVVTANKDVVAQFGKDMFAAAEKGGADFFFEGSVAGGIPIVYALKQSLTANRITDFLGIVNGTTNYILTKMENGSDFVSALTEAQSKGYAESDPTSDIEGLDAARKVAILASIAFNTRVKESDVSVKGITSITPLDITYANDLGYTIKLLAIGKDTEQGVDVRVHPALVPKSHPLASVSGVYNAIFVKGNAIGEAMFYGPGAGSLPTASAVVGDIIAASRNILTDSAGKMGCTCYEEKKFCPLEETESSYYIRLMVDDEPGVLGAIATVFGQNGVSLKSVIQPRAAIFGYVEIVVITHMVRHKKIQAAAEAISALDAVNKIINIIRVEREGGAE